MAEESGGSLLLTFTELEFILCEAPGWPRMRAQLNGAW